MSKRKKEPQEQVVIKVNFLDGTSRPAAATGNNAAWHCPCGRTLPLLGYSDTEASDYLSSHVVCPEPACGRTYKVIAPSIRTNPTEVREIKPVDRN